MQARKAPEFHKVHLNLDYAERTQKIVPGLIDMYRMSGILLAENAPPNAKVLVLGAGGGLELEKFIEMYPDWIFDGVDTSIEMIGLASERLKENANKVNFCLGEIEVAPDGPYDSASCLLTLHFMDSAKRLKTLQAIHQRLKPHAPLVVVHHSFSNDQRNEKRCRAFAISSGIPAELMNNQMATLRSQLPILEPAEDSALLKKAGFNNIELFYAGFTFRGWVGYKS
ncbi:class I SAM-dependent methyltransferase [Methylophilus sp. 3sh_L]|uniref:class I SAM-dependent methyltransferase n=1 Tax=Methylophilus sp. 3sh_L TaxID=3377114 RepID=UPI00398F5803